MPLLFILHPSTRTPRMLETNPITTLGLVLSVGGIGFAIYAVLLKHKLDRMRRDHDRADLTPGE